MGAGACHRLASGPFPPTPSIQPLFRRQPHSRQPPHATGAAVWREPAPPTASKHLHTNKGRN